MDIICHIIEKKKKDKKGFLCFCRPPEDVPFLVIERASQIKLSNKVEWCKVYQSEIVEENEDPQFSKISINMFALCQGHLGNLLRFSLYSQSPGYSKPLLYGSLETSAKELKRKKTKEYDLINERVKPKV